MSRKVFLSFLGTNNYIPCNYYLENEPDKKIANVKYIQEALIKLLCNHFTKDDLICTFTTELAYKMNYENNGQWNPVSQQYDLPNVGLKDTYLSLANSQYCPKVENQMIKEGFSEVEIWEIFETIANVIESEDELFLDITHAFRFLPMLGISLIDFLKTTKKISVKGIYYGAFEKLGMQAIVTKMPTEDRNAPILDLLSIMELQEWTIASNNFRNYGIVTDLLTLTDRNLRPILKESVGKDEISKQLTQFSKTLNTLIENIQTNRGKELNQFDREGLQLLLSSINKSKIPVKPLKQLFEIIEEKVSPIVKTNFIWLESSKWCMEHNLLQQGITQLQEGIIAFILERIHLEKSDVFYNAYDEKSRSFISGVLNISYKKIPENDWNESINRNSDKVYTLLKHPLVEDLSSIFCKLTALRNDIQHAGYLDNSAKSNLFKRHLQSFLSSIEPIIQRYYSDAS